MDEQKEIRDLLEEEIRSEFGKVSSLQPGSKEHSEAIESLTKLYKLNIEEVENDRSFRQKSEESVNKDLELKLKAAEIDESAKTRYFRLAVEGVGIVLPLIFYGIWMKRGFEFEKEGTFTSSTFKGLINKFRTR